MGEPVPNRRCTVTVSAVLRTLDFVVSPGCDHFRKHVTEVIGLITGMLGSAFPCWGMGGPVPDSAGQLAVSAVLNMAWLPPTPGHHTAGAPKAYFKQGLGRFTSPLTHCRTWEMMVSFLFEIRFWSINL
jgi:hypothetical protein